MFLCEVVANQLHQLKGYCGVSHVLGSVHRLVSHVLEALHCKGEIVTSGQVQLDIGVRVQLLVGISG